MHRSRPVQLVALLLLMASAGCGTSRDRRSTAQSTPTPAAEEAAMPSTAPLRRPAFASNTPKPPNSKIAPAKVAAPPAVVKVAGQDQQDDSLVPAKMDVMPSDPTSISTEQQKSVSSKGESSLSRVKEILEESGKFDAKYPDFVCRLTRTERIRNTVRSPEVMLMKFRRKPRSVYLQWLDPANDGRATVWVDGENKGKMISRGGRGDLLLAGKTMWLDPNGTLARSKSTQPITDTGFDKTCAKIWNRYEHLERGDTSLGTLTTETGPDPENPALTYNWIIHQCPPNVDDDLPDGGVHRYGFRPDNGRLEVVEALNRSGQPVYTFRFERFIPVNDLTDDDFNPDLLWPKKEAQKPPSEAERVVRGEGDSDVTR